MRKAFLVTFLVSCMSVGTSWRQATVSATNTSVKSGTRVLFQTGSSAKRNQRRLKILRVAHDLLQNQGKGIDPDFFAFSRREKDSWIATNRVRVPELQMVRTQIEPLQGVHLASTIYLPEKNELADDAIIIADHLVFSGQEAVIKGAHHLFFFATDVQVLGDGSGKRPHLTIDVSGHGFTGRKRHDLGSAAPRPTRGLVESSILDQGRSKSRLRNTLSGSFLTSLIQGSGQNGHNGSNGGNGADGGTGSCTTLPAGNGENGGGGNPGEDGDFGTAGMNGENGGSAYGSFYTCPRGDFLFLDLRGKDGTPGGSGGNGGNGGLGGNGGKGGDGIGVDAGNGGNGGTGGNGGAAGDGGWGGDGGDGGDADIDTDWCTWSDGGIEILVDGGAGGAGGAAGSPGGAGGSGVGGQGGSALTSSDCPTLKNAGSTGTTGGGGSGGASALPGSPGNYGSSGTAYIHCDGC